MSLQQPVTVVVRGGVDAFMSRLQQDVEFGAKVRGAGDVNSVAAIAREAGFEVSANDVSEILGSESKSVSSDELDTIAGTSEMRKACWWTCSTSRYLD